jgi:hypothetical protein
VVIRWLSGVIVLLTVLTPAHAEVHAFGIKPGTKVKDAPIKIDGEPGWLVIRMGDVPRPHPWLRAYTVNINSKMEICSVTGSGDLKIVDKSQGTDILKQMEIAYGPPRRGLRDPDTIYFDTKDLFVSAHVSYERNIAQVRIIFKPISECKDYKSEVNPFMQ